MNFILCAKCKKAGFVRPSACCPSGFPEAGDCIEFLSDKQTEKGPSAGTIHISCGKQLLVKHSDCTEEFNTDNLEIVRKTKGHDGRTLWMCS